MLFYISASENSTLSGKQEESGEGSDNILFPAEHCWEATELKGFFSLFFFFFSSASRNVCAVN